MCINLGGVFRNASQSLYRAAELLEGSSLEEPRPADREDLERAEYALSLVAARLRWPELDDYIAELGYRRTGVRPGASDPANSPNGSKSIQQRVSGVARYLVAELTPTAAPVPFEIAFDDCEEAMAAFDERERFHSDTLLDGPAPLILADREMGVMLRSNGDLTGFDLPHHAVDGVLTMQGAATRRVKPARLRTAPAGCQRRFIVREVVYSMNAGIVWAVGCTALETAVRSFGRRVKRDVQVWGEPGAIMAFDRQRRRLVCWTDKITDHVGAARYWFGVGG
jgi:hypothetical protein